MEHPQNNVYQSTDIVYRSQWKQIIFYLFILISVIISSSGLKEKGYSIAAFFIQSSLPGSKVELNLSSIIKQYIYELTHVMLGETHTLLTGAMPYLEFYEPFQMIYGEATGYFEQDEKFELAEESESNNLFTEAQDIDLEKFKDTYYVFKNYIAGDAELALDTDFLSRWDYYNLVTRPLQIEKTSTGPQVLIFHTHSKEAYIGGLTVVDMGAELKNVLEKEYGIEVLHVTDSFYLEGSSSVTGAYERMEPVIQQVLADNPSISVCIDLHRDGLDNTRIVTELNGKETAKVMFVNGLCMNRNVAGDIVEKTDLPNPYLEDNLAFSIQAQTVANTYYPGLMRKIYYNEWRYSTHMMPRSLLVELGANTNTGEEALNAIAPLADILAKVLQKD